MLIQDIRYGLRTALKNKTVTAVSIACLAIGIGLNTMIFSVVDGVLIRPLPYHDPDRLVADAKLTSQGPKAPGSRKSPNRRLLLGG